MAKFKFFKYKKNWKNWLTVGLGVLLSLGAVFGVSSIVKKANEDTKTISLTYSVGGLDANGKYEETEDSIYTKDAFECQGLKITPDFDSQVSYQVFFYDMNDRYLESSDVLTEFYEGIPLLAKYARIEISPKDDDKVSWYEVNKYANDITITVDKKQTFGYENNLAIVNVSMKSSYWNTDESGKYLILDIDEPEYCSFEMLDVSACKELVFIMPANLVDNTHLGIFLDSTKENVLSWYNTSIKTPIIKDNYAIYTIAVPDDASYFVINALFKNACNYYLGVL